MIVNKGRIHFIVKCRRIHGRRGLVGTHDTSPRHAAFHDSRLGRVRYLHQHMFRSKSRIITTAPNHGPCFVTHWDFETEGLYMTREVLDDRFPFNDVRILLSGFMILCSTDCNFFCFGHDSDERVKLTIMLVRICVCMVSLLTPTKNTPMNGRTILIDCE